MPSGSARSDQPGQLAHRRTTGSDPLFKPELWRTMSVYLKFFANVA